MPAPKLLFDIVSLTQNGKVIDISQYRDTIINIDTFVKKNPSIIETPVFSNLTPMGYITIHKEYLELKNHKKKPFKNYIIKPKLVSNGKEEFSYCFKIGNTTIALSSISIQELIKDQCRKLAKPYSTEIHDKLGIKVTKLLNKIGECAKLYCFKDKNYREAFQAYLKEEIQAFTNNPENIELRSNKYLLTKFFNLFLTAVACAISFGAYPLIQWYRNENTWVIIPTYEHIVDHDLRNKVEQKCKELQQASNLGK